MIYVIDILAIYILKYMSVLMINYGIFITIVVYYQASGMI